MYDLAISFAGEDRSIAEALAQRLKERGFLVFFDDYEQANLLGECLTEYLTDIYKNKAKYCLVLVSKHYVRKRWTRHEWKAAQARAFEAYDEAYILPIRLNDTELPGLLPTVGYLPYSSLGIDKCVQIIAGKVGGHARLNRGIREAEQLVDSGGVEEAIIILEKLENEYSEFSENNYALKLIANLLIMNGNSNEALSYFEKALQNNKEDSDLHFLCGICAFRIGDFDKAIRYMESCLGINPNNVTAIVELKLAKIWRIVEKIPFARRFLMSSMPTNWYHKKLKYNKPLLPPR